MCNTSTSKKWFSSFHKLSLRYLTFFVSPLNIRIVFKYAFKRFIIYQHVKAITINTMIIKLECLCVTVQLKFN